MTIIHDEYHVFWITNKWFTALYLTRVNNVQLCVNHWNFLKNYIKYIWQQASWRSYEHLMEIKVWPVCNYRIMGSEFRFIGQIVCSSRFHMGSGSLEESDTAEKPAGRDALLCPEESWGVRACADWKKGVWFYTTHKTNQHASRKTVSNPDAFRESEKHNFASDCRLKRS